MTASVRAVKNDIPITSSSRISVANISNEVGSVKNVLSQFFVFLSTPVYLRSCGFGDCSLAFLLTGSAHSLHRFGVVHQTSLRSLLTMMSSSNSPHLGEAGRLFRDSITAMQDHVIEQAFPHGHHRASVATDRGDRIPGNRSGHAAGSRAGSPAFVRLLLSPSPALSAPACA